jgi:DNA modification methylase
MAPEIALKAFSGSRQRLTVLDPMMGSGTVLAAARAKGHFSIGIDIDPLAVLIGSVWTTAVNKSRVRKESAKILARARQVAESLSYKSAYPKNADSETRAFIRYWFDPYARVQVAALATAIHKCRSTRTRQVLWCAFSRLIIAKQAGVSLALDLAHSRPHKHFDTAPIKPFASFLKAVDKVLENCISSNEADRGPSPRVELGDARQLALRNNTVDLVITSPPYLNAIDYLRCSKFSLVWMGHNTNRLRRIRRASVGSEVGEYDRNISARQLISDLKLKSCLSTRQQAVLSRFIGDMEAALREVFRVLVPGGKAIYVVGENTVRGTYIANAKIIAALARKAGLRLVSERKRTLPPNRRYLPPPSRRKRTTAALDARMRREVVLKFIKPRLRRA